ncbi:MAG: DNA-directed RNA polymerase subunit beta' [Mollicutes bacterium]|nr:DNA-directed RNA polymerase subunit beta' [Mollicutes bacterium]
MFDVNDLSSIKVGLASPEKIRQWSHGEVTKPETINYRSQKPEMDGLYCEKIFGPSKDYECHCGKYKKIRYAGVVCEKCGVEVISKEVRRERMGHIELASPCSHIWYLKGIPSRMGLVLAMLPKELEEIIYFSAHVCLNPGTSKILEYKQFIDDRRGKEIFISAIRDISDSLEPDTYDKEKAESLINKLSNPNEPFDFFGCASFISAHTGAEFGEGAEAIKRLLREVNLDEEFENISKQIKESQGQKLTKLTKRLEVIDAFRKSNNKPEWMILDALPVIPPDLRPMLQLDGGRFATSDLNDLYRRVISRNNRLKKLIDMNAPGVILMNEKRMLQEAVDALIDNGRRNGKPVTGAAGRPLKSLSGALKGKQGRFRQNLLGKRVDYSGRSVIAVGPSLKMYQCGLPREMAINLLRPFIASVLIRDGKCLLHKQADRKIDARDEDVLNVVEKIISQHPVLLNRAPTLHRLGIQAFQPVLVDGRAIRLHPLVCTGFNADFDGDQMAVHVPLGKAAQEEALNLMLASNNILAPKDGKPIVTPSQDMLIGNYYLTLEATKEDFYKKANKFEEAGDLEEAEKYREYAKLEGKVFKDIDECYKAYLIKDIHLHTRIALPGKALKKSGFSAEMNNKYLITTVGKVIFNLIFPSDFPYINEPSAENLKRDLDKFFVPKGTNIPEYIASLPVISPIKKKNVTEIIDEVFHRYGTSKTSAILDKIKDQGFRFSTISGLTIAISDINVLNNKHDYIVEGDKEIEHIEKLYEKGFLTDSERHNQVVRVWTRINSIVSDGVAEALQKDNRNPLFIMSDSGARGSKSNFTQLMGMRGLMGSTSGETIELPVKSCFREGLNVSEFFTGTHGARKGGADTALKTADSGYLTRRLVDVSQDVIVREEDCHSDHGSYVSDIIDTSQNVVIVSLYDRLVGRFSCHDIINPKTGEVIIEGDRLIDEKKAREIVDSGITKVEIRSLFGCETKDGVCVHCYGRNLATGELVEVGEAVGIMAAQSIGEPGTQLTMRTFHSGGVAGGDITQGLPRVQELFEARNPKGEALISEISGVVTDIVDEGGIFTVKVTNELEEKVYKTNFNARLRVKKGDTIKNGGKITEGAISPKRLLEVADVGSVQRYIIKEVQKVYRSQGIGISDKHIEVIVRQMLRKVVIIDGGDTEMIPGTRVSLVEFTRLNKEALLSGKRPAVAQPLVLGITKAALETESFLSAASFQETTRVLTDAAIKGKIDTLHGLKENVITGKLIPAGRGLLTTEQERELLKDFDVLGTMKSVRRQYLGSHDKDYDNVDEVEDNVTIEEEYVSKVDNY